jgi:hypothetical protein
MRKGRRNREDGKDGIYGEMIPGKVQGDFHLPMPGLPKLAATTCRERETGDLRSLNTFLWQQLSGQQVPQQPAGLARIAGGKQAEGLLDRIAQLRGERHRGPG